MSDKPQNTIERSVGFLVQEIHGLNRRVGWWTDENTGEDLRGKRNIPTDLMLIVSEIAEAMEGHRKDLMDDKLPHRKAIEVELADALIRICDISGGNGWDLAGAVAEKLAYNATRVDHTMEARRSKNGKKY